MSDIKISDIFELEKIKGYKTSELKDGPYPLIMSKADTNGISKYVDKYSYDTEEQNHSKVITVPITGSVGYCFVQSGKFCISDDVPPNCLKLKPEYQFLQSSLGLLAYLMTQKFTRIYNYSTKLNNARLMNETISLPTIDGKINENLLNAYVYEMMLI